MRLLESEDLGTAVLALLPLRALAALSCACRGAHDAVCKLPEAVWKVCALSGC